MFSQSTSNLAFENIYKNLQHFYSMLRKRSKSFKMAVNNARGLELDRISTVPEVSQEQDKVIAAHDKVLEELAIKYDASAQKAALLARDRERREREELEIAKVKHRKLLEQLAEEYEASGVKIGVMIREREKKARIGKETLQAQVQFERTMRHTPSPFWCCCYRRSQSPPVRPLPLLGLGASTAKEWLELRERK
jgi:Zn-dependent oligopeptidase